MNILQVNNIWITVLGEVLKLKRLNIATIQG